MPQNDFLPACLDLLAEGLLITDASHSDGIGPTIVYVNSAIEQMTGYSAAELIGKTPRIFQCDETDRSALDRIRSALDMGQPIAEILVNAHKDGRRNLVEVKIVPERDDSDRVVRFISIQREMTDIIRSQAERNQIGASFRLLFDENPTPMYVVERNSLKILKVNDAWCQVIGYDRATSITLRSSVIRPDIPPDLLAESIYNDALSGRLSGPYQFVGKNGRSFPVMTMRRLITFEGREAIISTLWDVTELEAARAQAHNTTERLEQVSAVLATRTKELLDAQHLAKIGSWIWNLDHRSLIFSPEMWFLLGYPSSEAPVTYDQLRSILHTDDYKNATNMYYRAINERNNCKVEYRVINQDGEVRFVLTYAEPIFDGDRVYGLRGTTQDITEIRTVELKLRASEDHYRHMVDLHPQIPWTAAPDGGIIEAGARWFLLTGMTSEESFPNGWTKAVRQDDLPGVLSEWTKCLTDLVPLDVEFRIRNIKGHFIWVRVRAAVRLDQEGRPLRWYGTMEDITDRKNAEEARRESEKLAAEVLDATSDAVLVLDADLKIIFQNETARKLFGVIKNNRANNMLNLLKLRKFNPLTQEILTSYNSMNSKRVDFFWKKGDIWLDVFVRPDSKKISLFMRDVSDQKRAQRQLQYAARHDALTGAPNRVELFDQLASHLESSTRSAHIALMCLDLDFFKEVNDTLGHPVGDTVLKLFVNRLRSCIRSNDLLARTGGDEFMILQTEVQSRRDVELLAERVVSIVKQPFQIEGREIQLGVSIGITVSDGGEQTSGEIYKQADLALYAVKLNSRGGYQFFESTMDKEIRTARQFRSDLAGAIHRHELSVVFQPIVRMTDENLIGAEALLRWRHPRRGNISPAQFIPLAEESGYIIEIGEWVLRESCRAARTWPNYMMLSVNVSPKQMERSNFSNIVADALKENDFSPARLFLEVTESVFSSNTDAIKKTINALTSHGIRMVLDDFGTGYSSLAYLDTFEVRKLKIDRSFVSKIEEATQPMPILEAIMGLARGLGLTVTAEGVETRTQFDYLRNIKCHEAQGYLFGKPMSSVDLVALLESHGDTTMQYRQEATLMAD